jgi:hypothetical protein
MCVCISCISIRLHLRAHVCSMCECLCGRACARAVALCAQSRCTAATGGIYSSARAALCPRRVNVGRACVCGVVSSAGVARVGRRRDVDTRDRKRAVGCATGAHVRDRRRWCHLRHRRRHRRLLPGRVGEHRRRCASRTTSGGTRGGVVRGTHGDTKGYYTGLKGYCMG